MRIEITIRHHPQEVLRAKREMGNLLAELGQLCEIADTQFIEDPNVERQDWLRPS